MERCRWALVLSAILAMSEIGWAGVNQWTSLGPDGGGAHALALDPQNPTTIYALTFGGIFKSTDAGASWHATGALLSGDLPGSPRILAIDPRTPSTLYTARESGGVFKSTDAGATWNPVNSGLLAPLAGICTIDPTQPVCQQPPQAARVSDLAVDPQNSSTVYAATGYGGIFKTTNGGTSWNAVNSGLAMNGVAYLSVTIDPQNPRALYTASGIGPFKSTDGGASWAPTKSGLPPTCVGSPRVVINPRNSATLLYSDCNGLFKSTDGGATWSSSGLPAPRTTADPVFDPQNTSVVYAATYSGVFKSTDAAATWALAYASASGSFITALAVDPQTPSTLYAAAASSAVFKSTDGAANWSTINSGLRAIRIRSMAVDGATVYANSIDGAYKSTDRGAGWNRLTSVFVIWAIDPRNPAVLYGNGPDGLSKSSDGGMSWSPAKAGLPEGLCHEISSVAIDAEKTNTLYAGIRDGGIRVAPCSGASGGGVYKSVDGGASWARQDAQPKGGGVLGLSIDPQIPSTVYAWNGKGLFKSTDAGASWNVSGNFKNVNMLGIDPQDSSTIYLAAGWGGVFKTIDGGASWSEMNSGLPTIYVNLAYYYTVSSLAIDPQNPSTVYAGTGAGVFRSMDGGASWSAVNSGLTTLDVTTLAIDPQDTSIVYAGGAGGVFGNTFVR